MASKPVRVVLTIAMDLLVVIAVCATIGIVVRFFGTLANTSAGSAYLRFAAIVRVPAGFSAIQTPYGGVFDVDATITVALALLVEWALSVARKRA